MESATNSNFMLFVSFILSLVDLGQKSFAIYLANSVFLLTSCCFVFIAQKCPPLHHPEDGTLHNNGNSPGEFSHQSHVFPLVFRWRQKTYKADSKVVRQHNTKKP